MKLALASMEPAAMSSFETSGFQVYCTGVGLDCRAG